MSDSLEEPSIKAKIELANPHDVCNYSPLKLSLEMSTESSPSTSSSSENEEEIVSFKTKKIFTKKRSGLKKRSINYNHIKAKVPTRDIIPR